MKFLIVIMSSQPQNFSFYYKDYSAAELTSWNSADLFALCQNNVNFTNNVVDMGGIYFLKCVSKNGTQLNFRYVNGHPQIISIATRGVSNV